MFSVTCHNCRLALLPTWILLLPSLTAQSPATQPPLSTGRPNQTCSADLVPAGYVRFELGWSRGQERGAASKLVTHQAPGTTIRVGISNRLQADFFWSGAAWLEQRVSGVKSELHGIGDGGVDAKFLLWEEDGILPKTSVAAGITIPFQDPDLSSRRADPFLTWFFTHSLHDRFALTYNLGAVWSTGGEEDGDRDTLASLLYTLALDVSLEGNLGWFVEVFGLAAINDRGRPSNTVDTGLSYRLANKLILDAIVGWGVSEAAPDWFVGAGLTFRLPYRAR